MKNFLFVCVHNPFETHSAAHQRSRLICMALAQLGYVDIVCFGSQPEKKARESDIINCSVVFWKELRDARQSTFRNIITKILNLALFFTPRVIEIRDIRAKGILMGILSKKNYDFIVTRYLQHTIRFGVPCNKKLIVDLDDLPEESVKKNLENSKNLKYIYLKLIMKPTCFHTRRLVQKMKCAYVVNPLHTALCSNVVYLPGIPYFSLPNDWTSSVVPHTSNVAAVGKLNYTPNSEGIEHFIKAVWPSILTEIPQARFNIIGSFMTDEQKSSWERNLNVTVLGYVEDIMSEYLKMAVVVVPIYSGGGANVKLVEAMYAGKSCVVSRFATRGYEHFLRDGENIFIADNDMEFAQKTIKLLQNHSLNKDTAKKARDAVKDLFSFEHFSQIVRESIFFSNSRAQRFDSAVD